MDLPPGDYLAEVRASLDGESWTEPPATYAFSVAPPWWRRTWVMAAFALCALAALYGLYRWRLGFLLKLERQRTRIAMDLHDQMGSGLGSIGILGEVLGHAELGVGLPEQPEGGSGLENMEHRAREIDAELICGRRSPRGTIVTLRFSAPP